MSEIEVNPAGLLEVGSAVSELPAQFTSTVESALSGLEPAIAANPEFETSLALQELGTALAQAAGNIGQSVSQHGTGLRQLAWVYAEAEEGSADAVQQARPGTLEA